MLPFSFTGCVLSFSITECCILSFIMLYVVLVPVCMKYMIFSYSCMHEIYDIFWFLYA